MVCSICSTSIALRRVWPVDQQCPATSWRENRVGLVKNRGKLRFFQKVESESITEESEKSGYLLDPRESSQIETALTEVKNTRRPIYIPGQVCVSAFWVLGSGIQDF
jgi:hypothetical protein